MQNLQIRSGIGFDVHAFDENKSENIRLGGIDIPHDYALKGHSDADVVLHAITDALFGALCLGDIGDHFPPSDQTFKNMDSAIFLQKAKEAVGERNGQIIHVDITIICEKPKIRTHKEDMRKRITEILEIDVENINVKATTTEQLGFTGRGEGIAVQAIANVGLPI